MQVRIRRNERADLFGKTGSGKTTLARALLRSTNVPHVVFDPKWRYTDPGVKIVHRFDRRLDRQIVRVDPANLDAWDETFAEVWDRGDAIVYVDEVTLLLPGTRTILPWHRRAIVTGRERNLPVWNGTQRPSEIGSSVIFTETEHFFVFRLQFEADREKACAFTSEQLWRLSGELKRRGRKAKHDFIYYGVDDDRAIYVNATRQPAGASSSSSSSSPAAATS